MFIKTPHVRTKGLESLKLMSWHFTSLESTGFKVLHVEIEANGQLSTPYNDYPLSFIIDATLSGHPKSPHFSSHDKKCKLTKVIYFLLLSLWGSHGTGLSIPACFGQKAARRADRVAVNSFKGDFAVRLDWPDFSSFAADTSWGTFYQTVLYMVWIQSPKLASIFLSFCRRFILFFI